MSRFRAFIVGLVVALPLVVTVAESASALPPPADTFHGLVPARLMDTRVGGSTIDHAYEGIGARGPASTTNVAILGRGGLPGSGVGAVALNITAVAPTADSFITVWPTGSLKPNASNLNLVAGVTVPNMVIVPVGTAGQVSLFNATGSTHLLVDVLGWFPTGASFTGLVPARVMDTRVGGTTIDHAFEGIGARGPASTIDMTILNRGGVPSSGVGAVALNITSVAPTTDSFVTVWPTGATKPNASNLNLRAGVNVPNMVIVPVGTGGAISLFNANGSTHLLVDVLGWFPAGDAFTGLVPARVMDTRVGGTTTDHQFEGIGPRGPASTIDLTISNRGGVPTSGVGAVVLNVTSVSPTASGFVTVWPTGSAMPNASNLNLQAGRNIPNMVIVPLGTGGAISLFNSSGSTHLLVDVLGWFPTTTTGPSMIRASVLNQSVEGIGGDSGSPDISADGRYTVFASSATNLVDSDTNGLADIFMYDRETDQTYRVDLGPGALQAVGGPSENPSISADGRYVVFASTATNLVLGDTNGAKDIFMYDNQTGDTTRVNVGPGGVQAASFGSSNPDISADGNWIVYESPASNLVASDSNGTSDIFRYDRVNAVTTRINLSTSGLQAKFGQSITPTISGDGRYIAYVSFATTLLDVTYPIPPEVGVDTNANWDVFVYDAVLATTTRISVDNEGDQVDFGGFNPDISVNGRYIVYDSATTQLLDDGDVNTANDLFLFDRQLAITSRISVDSDGNLSPTVNADSDHATISGDGRYVTYQSESNVLVPGDGGGTDVFVFDRIFATTTRVSVDTAGNDADSGSFNAAMSANGHYIAFESYATDLIASDLNGFVDVFLAYQGTS